MQPFIQRATRSRDDVGGFVFTQIVDPLGNLALTCIVALVPVVLLLVLLARTGKEIRDIGFVEIDRDGTVVPGRAAESPGNVDGVKIEFQVQDRNVHTLYYFSSDLSDAALSASGFLKFSERLGSGASLLKGASYRLHEEGFILVRDFILGRYESIVQDDSGIPLRHFNLPDWWLQPFGSYRTPVTPFAPYDQEELHQLFRLGRPEPINFGFGYRRRPDETNFMLAVRKHLPSSEGQVQTQPPP